MKSCFNLNENLFEKYSENPEIFGEKNLPEKDEKIVAPFTKSENRDLSPHKELDSRKEDSCLAPNFQQEIDIASPATENTPSPRSAFSLEHSQEEPQPEKLVSKDQEELARSGFKLQILERMKGLLEKVKSREQSQCDERSRRGLITPPKSALKKPSKKCFSGKFFEAENPECLDHIGGLADTERKTKRSVCFSEDSYSVKITKTRQNLVQQSRKNPIQRAQTTRLNTRPQARSDFLLTYRHPQSEDDNQSVDLNPRAPLPGNFHNEDPNNDKVSLENNRNGFTLLLPAQKNTPSLYAHRKTSSVGKSRSGRSSYGGSSNYGSVDFQYKPKSARSHSGISKDLKNDMLLKNGDFDDDFGENYEFCSDDCDGQERDFVYSGQKFEQDLLVECKLEKRSEFGGCGTLKSEDSEDSFNLSELLDGYERNSCFSQYKFGNRFYDIAILPVYPFPRHQKFLKLARKYNYADYAFEVRTGLISENQIFYHTGELFYEGEVLNNRRKHGAGKIYHKNGHTMYEGEFKFDNIEGFDCKIYDDSGLLEFEGRIVKGEIQGLGKSYWKNGQLRYRGFYKNNMPHGATCQVFYVNGTCNYYGPICEGVRNGHGSVYHRNAQLNYEGEFKCGLAEGDNQFVYDCKGRVIYNGPIKCGRIQNF